jgi:hypothetical protein
LMTATRPATRDDPVVPGTPQAIHAHARPPTSVLQREPSVAAAAPTHADRHQAVSRSSERRRPERQLCEVQLPLDVAEPRSPLLWLLPCHANGRPDP